MIITISAKDDYEALKVADRYANHYGRRVLGVNSIEGTDRYYIELGDKEYKR